MHFRNAALSAVFFLQLLLVSCATSGDGNDEEHLEDSASLDSILQVDAEAADLCMDVLGYGYPADAISYEKNSTGTLMDIQTKGHHGPIVTRFLLAEGTIIDCKVLESREQRGRQVKSRRFLKQFIGKSVGSDYSLSGRVEGITGATRSSRAVQRAAILALRLNDEVLQGK